MVYHLQYWPKITQLAVLILLILTILHWSIPILLDFGILKMGITWLFVQIAVKYIFVLKKIIISLIRMKVLIFGTKIKRLSIIFLICLLLFVVLVKKIT